MRVHHCEIRNRRSGFKLRRHQIIGTQRISRAEEKVFLRVWKRARTVRRRGVSEIKKDACSWPENQSRKCLPYNTQSWSEVAFLRMPQRGAHRGECRGGQIAHLRHRHLKSAIR